MHSQVSDTVPYLKTKIPKAVREQCWLVHAGEVYKSKCAVSWCKNDITVFDFQCGHNVPESKGGRTEIQNLLPICARCNTSMGNHYTIDDWSHNFAPKVVEVPVVYSVGCPILNLQRFRYRPNVAK